MRKYCYILPVLALFAIACDQDDKQEIYPEEYFKVLYIKDSGTRDMAMNTAQDAVPAQMLVVKGGAHPEMPASGRLEVMSLQEAAAQYGYPEETIGIIPEGSYQLPAPAVLTKEEPNRQMEVTLFPPRMAPAMREKPELTWILPLRLACDDGSVNKDNSLVLLNCSVVSPLIGWADNKPQDVTIDYKTLDYRIPIVISKTEINKSAVTGRLETLGAEAVEEYNAAHGTAYPSLPAGSYTLGDMHIDAGELAGGAPLILSRSGLTADVEYLLPLRIMSVSSDLFEISEEVKYYIVGNPKFAYEEVDPSQWKIAFINSEDRNSRFWAMNMFNRNPESNFCSYYVVSQQTKIGTDVDDFRYPVEGSYPGTCVYPTGRMAGSTIDVLYPCCDGVRKYDKVVVVVDFGETINIHSVGLSKMAGNVGNLDLKGAEFFTEDQFTLETAAQYKDVDVTKYRAAIANYSTANAGNDWRLFLQWSDIPKGTTTEGLPTVWKVTPDDKMNTVAAKGRYLKIHPTSSYRTAQNCIEICDLYIRRLIAIDGEPAI